MNLMAKNDPEALVTNKILGEAVDTLLQGMDNMLEEQRKYLLPKDLRKVRDEMATKRI